MYFSDSRKQFSLIALIFFLLDTAYTILFSKSSLISRENKIHVFTSLIISELYFHFETIAGKPAIKVSTNVPGKPSPE